MGNADRYWPGAGHQSIVLRVHNNSLRANTLARSPKLEGPIGYTRFSVRYDYECMELLGMASLEGCLSDGAVRLTRMVSRPRCPDIARSDSDYLLRLLSFVTIVTPATLTVHLGAFPENSTRLFSEPTVNYLNASDFMGSGGISFAIATASGRINRFVTSVAAQGRIMALPVPATNASYTSNFFGLSLECAKHDDGIYETAMQKFNNVSLDGSRRTYLLAAFAPAIRPGVDTADPPLNSSSPNAFGLGILNGLNATMELEGTRTDPINLPMLDDLSADTSRFYIITDSPVANRSFNSTIGNFELIECLAYNSSYQVDFNFSNGLQQLDVRSVERMNGISQVSLLQTAYDENENNVNATCIGTSCGICPYPAFTYLTILKAFGRLFTGLIDENRFGSETAFATSIRSTVIAQAMEMPVGKDLGPQCGNEGRNEDERVSSGNISMADALEQLMQNVTLSLFSLPSLL